MDQRLKVIQTPMSGSNVDVFIVTKAANIAAIFRHYHQDTSTLFGLIDFLQR